MSFIIEERILKGMSMGYETRSHEIAWSDLTKAENLQDVQMCFRIKDRALTIGKDGHVQFGQLEKRPHGMGAVFECDGFGKTDPVNFMEAYLRFPEARKASPGVWWNERPLVKSCPQKQ